MEINKVLDGLERYIDNEIYAGMNENQQTIYILAVGALKENAMDVLGSNAILRSMLSISRDGDVDLDRLHKLLQVAVRKRDKLTLNIPMFGKLTFNEADITNIIHTIREG